MVRLSAPARACRWPRELLLTLACLPLQFFTVRSNAFVDELYVLPLTNVVAGTEFRIDVLGGGFDPVNDKVLIVPGIAECGTAGPPLGSPHLVSGYAATTCDGHSSAASKMECAGPYAIYQPGRWSFCVCDADRNITDRAVSMYEAGSPELEAALVMGCASKERYTLGGYRIGSMNVNGPQFAGTVQFRAGKESMITLYGTEMSHKDRIRIVDGETQCMDKKASKKMHDAVAEPTDGVIGEPEQSRSHKRLATWDYISILETGTYQVCWCGAGGCEQDEEFLVHAATIVVVGPVVVPPHPCITGVLCVPFIEGTGLRDLDRIRIVPMYISCGGPGSQIWSPAVISGTSGIRTSGTDTKSFFGGIFFGMQGDFKICWCGRLSAACLNCCEMEEDFNIFAGNVTVRGVIQGNIDEPPLGIPFNYILQGWGLSDNDRIRIVDEEVACGTSAAKEFSDGVWLDSRNSAPPGVAEGPSSKNRTSVAWVGIMLTKMRGYRVCWCARFFGGCLQGEHFKLDIGLIYPKGPRNATDLRVVPHKPFVLRADAVPGSQLLAKDRMRIVSPKRIGHCGATGTYQNSPAVAHQSCWPVCEETAHYARGGAPYVYEGGAYEIWDPIVLTETGDFKICWCNGNRHDGCTSDSDFNVQIGVIRATGVVPGHAWACSAFSPCVIKVPHERGTSASDAVQLIPALSDTKACGQAEQVHDVIYFTTGTRITGQIQNDFGLVDDYLAFNLGTARVPGLFEVCYCQNQGLCTKDIDFFQPVGTLRVSGLSSQEQDYVCYLRGNCELIVKGSGLGREDALTLVNPQTSCGMGWDDSSINFDEGVLSKDGTKVFIGTLTGSSDTGVERWVYNLGFPSVSGRYRVCYCSAIHASTGMCNKRTSFSQMAGWLYVRGSNMEVNSKCQQGEVCKITLRNDVVHRYDRILFFRPEHGCGSAEENAFPAWMVPQLPEYVGPDNLVPDMYKEVYDITNVAEPGTFRVCYCAYMSSADSCVTGPNLVPNPTRFSHDAGVVEVGGTIKSVSPVTKDEDGENMPLPATDFAVSVTVEALVPSVYFTCVVTDKPALYVPRKSDLENCTKQVGRLNDRQALMPRCWGVGKAVNPSRVGPNYVHVPVNVSAEKFMQTSDVHVWCYDSLCANDRCVMPPSKTGLVQKLTGGLKKLNERWIASINAPFSLRVPLTATYNVGQSWPRVKIIERGFACDRAELWYAVEGITCIAGGVGKCEPHPKLSFWGSETQLVWDGITIRFGGEYDVCYCDRHSTATCAAWIKVGSILVSGPKNVGGLKYDQNPSKPFDLVLHGRGFSTKDRIRIIDAEEDCTAELFGPEPTPPAQFAPAPPPPAVETTNPPTQPPALAASTPTPEPPMALATPAPPAQIVPSTPTPAVETPVASATPSPPEVVDDCQNSCVTDFSSTNWTVKCAWDTCKGCSACERRLALTNEWRSGAPTYANYSIQWWTLQMDQIGDYAVCWCGSRTQSCALAQDFTVRTGTLSVRDKRDCKLTDAWVAEQCSRPCGGGVVTYRRSVILQAQGGGKACPPSEELVWTDPCNMEPCPLARVDRVVTEPASPRAGEPFMMYIDGLWMTPKEDRILLVSEEATCGTVSVRNHFGGASCELEGSTEQRLICGNGISSIRVERPGRFRICFCDASAAAVERMDGTGHFSQGNFAAEGLFSAGCADPTHYAIEPKQGHLISVGAPPLVDGTSRGSKVGLEDEDPERDVPSWFVWLIPTLLAVFCCIGACVCGVIGWRRYIRTAKKKTKGEMTAMEEGVKAALGALDFEKSTPAGPDPSTLAWYEQFYRNQGHPPGTGTAVATAAHNGVSPNQMLALPAPAQPQHFQPEPPPQQLALPAPPPPPAMPPRPPPPPTAPINALPAPGTPRNISPRSNISGTPRNKRSSLKNAKSFGDLVAEGNRRPNTAPGTTSFLDRDLTPLPTPTGTPRGVATPRSQPSQTPLAIEDSPPAFFSLGVRDPAAKNAEKEEKTTKDETIPKAEEPPKIEEPPPPEPEPTRPATTESARRPGTTESDDRVSLALSEDSTPSRPPTGTATPAGIPATPSGFGNSFPAFGGIAQSSSSAPATTETGSALRDFVAQTALGPRLTESTLQAHESATAEAKPAETKTDVNESEASGATPRDLRSFLKNRLSIAKDAEKQPPEEKPPKEAPAPPPAEEPAPPPPPPPEESPPEPAEPQPPPEPEPTPPPPEPEPTPPKEEVAEAPEEKSEPPPSLLPPPPPPKKSLQKLAESLTPTQTEGDDVPVDDQDGPDTPDWDPSSPSQRGGMLQRPLSAQLPPPPPGGRAGPGTPSHSLKGLAASLRASPANADGGPPPPPPPPGKPPLGPGPPMAPTASADHDDLEDTMKSQGSLFSHSTGSQMSQQLAIPTSPEGKRRNRSLGGLAKSSGAGLPADMPTSPTKSKQRRASPQQISTNMPGQMPHMALGSPMNATMSGSPKSSTMPVGAALPPPPPMPPGRTSPAPGPPMAALPGPPGTAGSPSRGAKSAW